MASLHQRLAADVRSAAKAADRFERAGDSEKAHRALGIAEGLQAAAGIIGFGDAKPTWKAVVDEAPPRDAYFWAYLFDTGIRRLRWMSPEERCDRNGWSPPVEGDDASDAWVEVRHPDQEWEPKYWLPIEALPIEPAA